MFTLAIFGQTGSGKTSLSNALFGLNWRTDPAVACTQTVSQHEGKIVSVFNGDMLPEWRLLDTPGVGESEEADARHFQQLYESFHTANMILWVVQADTRAFTEDQESILRLTDNGQKIPKAHFVIGINQIDRVYPENWNTVDNVPSAEQFSLIPEKVNLVYKRFSPYLPIAEKHILPCSALRRYGLNNLVNAINYYRLKESKMSFFRKNVSLEQQKTIDKLRQVLGTTDFNRFQRLIDDELAKPPKIAIIGKAGVGKTTTINSLFDLQERVSHTTTGTKEPSENTIELPNGGQLSVIDMPGLGEDIELDRQYKEIYEKVLPSADVVLYVVQADLKALNEDQKILRDIVQNAMGNLKDRLVVGLNQVDKIDPGNWNEKFNYPSPEQEDNINRRCKDIQEKLSASLFINVEQVEYFSAIKRYRLYQLLAAIIKAAGNVGWKFSISPADPIELAAEEVRDLLRKKLDQ
ncbi:hypothetical protein NUACC21_74310 [Scytonema sp. NUACC21]